MKNYLNQLCRSLPLPLFILFLSYIPQLYCQEKSNVVVDVDGYTITKEEVFDLLITRYRAQCYEAIQELVVKHIIRQEAVKERITIDRVLIEKKRDEELQQRKKSVEKESQQSWQQYLEGIGKTEEELKKELYRSWKHTLALHRLIRLRDYRKDKVEARHIMVKSKEKAEEIHQKLRQGADFATLATKNSISQTSANGGKLPLIYRGDQEPEIEKVLFSLPQGKLSRVIKSKWGFHIFQVLSVKKGKPGTKWVDVKDQINRALEKKPIQTGEFQRWLKVMQSRYQIEQKF